MNIRAVTKLIGFLLMVVGVAMVACWSASIYFHEPPSARHGLMWSALITLTTGVVLRVVCRGPVDLSWRDGIGIGTFGWFFVTVFGALPYILGGSIPHPVSALFESVSGFTTTGASVITVVEPLPKSILLWRAMTHFIGGMGVLVLCVAILPFLGVGGMQLYRAEVSGPYKDRLTPRIATTATLLWGVYTLLCLLCTVLLRAGGMRWFDAVCHSFAALATGGFSTKTVSIAAYNSLYIEVILMVFMFLGATNFALHYTALRGRFSVYRRDAEFKFYVALWLVACAIVTFNIWHGVYPTLGAAARNGFFATTSLMTTTGFSTGDFDRWPAASRLTLMLLMVMGGCSGSTAGAIKQMRVMIVGKLILRRIRLFMHPQAVIQVKLGEQKIEPDVAANVLAFSLLYLIILAIASFLMTFFTHDIISAASSVIATMGGVGPGLGLVGPLQNYAAIPAVGKIVLIVCMMLGRLEFYTVLALLLPSFWKK